MPKVLTIGRNKGVKIKIAGVTSMKVPATNRMTFMIKRIIYWLSVIPRSSAEIACGICVKAITHPRMLDTPIRNTIIPLILALSTTIFQKLFKVMFLYKIPKIRA